MKTKERISGVYCIENIINHKKYIGQSVDIAMRWKSHKNDLDGNRHRNTHLQNSWNLYGRNNFIFYILEECSEEFLDSKEKYYISKFSTINEDLGYNKESGGNLGKQLSEEVKSKMSAAKSNYFGENNPFYGKHHTDETKLRLSESHKIENLSKETLEAMRGPRPSVSGQLHPRVRSVYCPELNQVFWGAKDVENVLGIKRSGVTQCCREQRNYAGRHPETGEPLHWHYVDDILNDIKITTIQN